MSKHNFSEVFGAGRGAPVERLSVRAVDGRGTSGELSAVLDRSGVTVQSADGTQLARISWPAFERQLQLTMVGGFAISPELSLDFPSLQAIWARMRVYHPEARR